MLLAKLGKGLSLLLEEIVEAKILIYGRLSPAAGEEKEQSDETIEKPAEAVEAERKPSPTLEGLLRARAALERLLEPQLQGSFLVSLNGVESGEIEAVVRARGRGDEVGCLRTREPQIPIVSRFGGKGCPKNI